MPFLISWKKKKQIFLHLHFRICFALMIPTSNDLRANTLKDNNKKFGAFISVHQFIVHFKTKVY